MTAISPQGAPPSKLLGSESGALRRLRLVGYAALFAFLVGLDAYGFWSHPQLFATAWTPSGQTRFLTFAATYLSAVTAILYFVPRRLPLILLLAMVITACAAVGVNAPAAVALFLMSALVLGRALLWGTGTELLPFEDMVLATLFGAVIYMTAVVWTAMLPVHYAGVHVIALALPFLIWPKALGQSFRSLAAMLRPSGQISRWDYLGFALAAFFPLAHLTGAVVLPQLNSDATVLHLAVPSIVAFKHYWSFDATRLVWGVFPIGMSWLMLPSYLLGGEFAARLLNFCFFFATVALLFSALRRWLSAAAAWLLIGLYASTPFFLTENGNIFVENLWVALLFGAAFAIWRFKETGQERYFLLAAALAAGSLHVKFLGAFVVLILALLILRDCLQRPIRLVWAAGFFVVMAAFPFVYAYLRAGNPVLPLMNHIFKSPYYAAEAFVGMSRPVPTSLYELTFNTAQWMDNGGTTGSLGFQYLVLVPLCLLVVGRTLPYFGWVSVTCAVGYLATLFMFAESNVRYLYPALPFITVLTAIVLAHARELSRPLYLSFSTFALVAMLVNAYAMPLSAWAHRDFSLAMAFGRIGIDEYLDWGAPERKVIAYLNLTRGHTVRVANFARPMIVEFKGDPVLGSWFNYLFTTKRLSGAKSAEDVHRLMREERITKFMMFKPDSGSPNFSPAVEAFLASYTEVEFAAGDVQLTRYKEPWRFSEEVLKNGDLAEGLAHWGHTPATVFDAATRTVAVAAGYGISQHVPIDDRLVYRYAITARCADPGTHVRLWINWFDARQRPLRTTLLPRRCEPTPTTFAEELVPPAGARIGEILVAGHEADRVVHVSNVSLKW